MIPYRKYTLDNGLTVIACPDPDTPMAAVNLIYRVGARNENPAHTGFAHLFEHLMFGGSKHAPEFDRPIQLACGENNAFTNNDYTDYYEVLPKDNVETALWLEADRMQYLDINEHTLELQKKVVIEEFNQRYLNKPYGDVWLLLRPLAFRVHPYRWATIGVSPDHIRDATLAEVRAFYERYYRPANAILSVAGDFPEDRVEELARKWFGDIKGGGAPADDIPAEPVQTAPRRLEVERDVPASVIYIAFHMAPRADRDFNVCDTISDLLSNGNSSRMYLDLVKEKKLFSTVNAFVSGDMDAGLFILTGQLSEGTDAAVAERELWGQLEAFRAGQVDDYELEKVKNKFEANTVFGELNVMNKAMNLGFYEMLGDIAAVNTETAVYRSVTREDIGRVARRIFVPENSATLLYLKKQS